MKSKQITKLLVVAAILLSITVFLKKEQAENPLISIPADLSNHPIYSKYKFDKAENIIYIGSQPLLTPTGHISETMKRDTILRNALMKLGMALQFYPFLKVLDITVCLSIAKIDLGFVGDMPAITAAASSEIIIPSVVQNGFISIIADHHMMVKELRGKRIGYASGSNAHYALLSALSANGLTEADVKLIPMEITDMPESLHNGNISAFSAWEPTSTIALKKHPNSTAIHRHLSTG